MCLIRIIMVCVSVYDEQSHLYGPEDPRSAEHLSPWAHDVRVCATLLDEVPQTSQTSPFSCGQAPRREPVEAEAWEAEVAPP